ncbi:MAG TPA: ATP-binding protein [Saprospiraceae bacterium]|nr:ATP-binding protein [Saprospiraceae bacterium]HMQ82309.1 ATP-binding protein [Saprospiraceae bacterium]
MKIEYKYFLFTGFATLLLLVSGFLIFKENKLFFFLIELGVITFMLAAYWLYREIFKPIRLLAQGVEAIQDQDFSVKLSKTGHPESDKLIDVYNTMIRHLRLERAATQEHLLLLEKITRISPIGILILSVEKKIILANPQIQKLLKINENKLRGQYLTSIDHPFFKVFLTLKNGESKVYNSISGEKLKIQKTAFFDRGMPCYFMTVEELTDAILSAEKETYGKIIRMMAHEINNSVGAVSSILDTLLQVQENEELRYAINLALNRTKQLKKFIGNYADIVRMPQPSKQKTDIVALVKNMANFMRYKIQDKTIDIQLNTPDQPLWVFVDAVQMEQVIINVLSNAIEAIEQQGTIKISVDQKPARLVIEDNGKGISTEKETMLFSPFYSDKPGGQGIGLTLSREVLMNHKLEFSLSTSMEGKTAFIIDLDGVL